MRNTQKVRIQDSRSRGQKQENLHKEKIGHPGQKPGSGRLVQVEWGGLHVPAGLVGAKHQTPC